MQPTRSAICVAPLAEQAARSLPPVLGPRLHSLCSLEAVPAFPRLPQCSWGAGRTPTQHAENDRRLSVDTVPTVPVATALQPVLVGAVQTPGQLIDVHVTSHTSAVACEGVESCAGRTGMQHLRIVEWLGESIAYSGDSSCCLCDNCTILEPEKSCEALDHLFSPYTLAVAGEGERSLSCTSSLSLLLLLTIAREQPRLY